MATPKKTLLSGIKPTSIPTLGNYIGALRNWRRLQQDFECYFPVVDLHAITEPIAPQTLRSLTLQVAALYLASGIDPAQGRLFIQSHVPEHAQLSWLLTCFTGMGELSRMTQYKDKFSKHENGIRAGLFCYPVLMAADILLYDTHVVPVGEDQKQHVELTRDLAERLNGTFARPLFIVPEPVIAQVGARIMDLQNPTAKMSKSDEEGKGVIFLLDSDKDILKKVKSAVTDSGCDIRFTPEKPGVANLLTINAALSGRTLAELEEHFSGKMYGHLKAETAELVVETVRPIRDEAQRLMTSDRAHLESVLREGAAAARERAGATLARVNEAMGFSHLCAGAPAASRRA